MDLNQCTFIGRFTADPKMKRNTHSGEIECTFTLAVNKAFSKKGITHFPPIVVRGEDKVKAVMKYCQVGKEVTILAEFQSKWYPPDKYGGKGVNFQIFEANRVIFGPDSQRVLKKKEGDRLFEMNRTVIIEEPLELIDAVKETIYDDIDDISLQLCKEEYDR